MKNMGVNFLQTAAWGRFQDAIGREVIEKSGDGWSYLAIVEKGRFARRLYCPYGPTVENAKALKAALGDLTTEARERKLDFLRIEPVGDIKFPALSKLGLVRSHHDVQPSHTVINDVSIDPEAITAGVSQSVRRYARKAEKAGVTYSVSYDPVDIRHFIDMIHDVSTRTGMKPMSDFYFSHIASALFPTHDAGLLFAELDGRKIAAIIFYNSGETMSYAHAASYSEYRNITPATGLGLYALLFAHDEGCKWFDWHGIAPENASKSHRWAGFTQFKLSFGGQRVERLGTWELPVRKMRYRLYKIVLKIAGKD
ncbi:FemA-like protein [Alphaproteobacteria bacterium]|nr:FemA-like protein [Alphaproteobacteria bacterium]